MDLNRRSFFSLWAELRTMRIRKSFRCLSLSGTGAVVWFMEAMGGHQNVGQDFIHRMGRQKRATQSRVDIFYQVKHSVFRSSENTVSSIFRTFAPVFGGMSAAKMTKTPTASRSPTSPTVSTSPPSATSPATSRTISGLRQVRSGSEFESFFLPNTYSCEKKHYLCEVKKIELFEYGKCCLHGRSGS